MERLDWVRQVKTLESLTRVLENGFLYTNAMDQTGLLNQPKNKSYSKALKISAVNDYLNGAGSLDDICLKYGIRSHTQL